MPCYYTGSAEGDAALAHEESNKKHKSTITKLTRMLCDSCKEMEAKGIEIPKSVKAWWIRHKKIDKKNEKAMAK